MNIPIISNTLAAMAYFPHDANDIDFGSKVSGLIFPVTPEVWGATLGCFFSITKNLSYNTMLKVTTAKYYIPSGRCIQAINYAERNEDGSVKHILV